MGTTPRRPRSLFGEILRRELESQGVSTRELARRLTKGEPDRLENTRRSLIRYIRGEVAPGSAAREAIAVALSVDPSLFAAEAGAEKHREVLYDAVENLVDALMSELTLRQMDGVKS